MNISLSERFFDPIKSIMFDEDLMDYKKLEYVGLLLEQMNDILSHNSYIIDYYRRNFLFISKQSLLLCGYTREEVMEMGFDFYAKILSPENLEKIIEMNEALFRFFYEASLEKKKNLSIFYDLILQKKDGTTFCVNHRLKPFLFTQDDHIWLSVCCMRPSSKNEIGNVKCLFKDTNECFLYSFEDKKWHEQPPIVLSEIEKFIAVETDKGTLEKQQAHQLGCTRSNIRYYKNAILKKTNTTTMREAILFLYADGIL